MNNTTMTAPVDVVTGCYEALLSGDVDRVRAALRDDAVLHVPGSHPLAGDHVGPDAILGFVGAIRQLTDDGEHIEVLDVLTGRDSVALHCRVTAQRGDRALDNTTVHLVHVTDGRVAGIWLHNFDGVAVDEFWS
jgi:ketosteroid isomerase-like protein